MDTDIQEYEQRPKVHSLGRCSWCPIQIPFTWVPCLDLSVPQLLSGLAANGSELLFYLKCCPQLSGNNRRSNSPPPPPPAAHSQWVAHIGTENLGTLPSIRISSAVEFMLQNSLWWGGYKLESVLRPHPYHPCLASPPCSNPLPFFWEHFLHKSLAQESPAQALLWGNLMAHKWDVAQG
jgi:hypothetical protein